MAVLWRLAMLLGLLVLVLPGNALSDKAARFQACFSQMMQAVIPPEDTNTTAMLSGSTPGVLSDELADLMSGGMPDSMVDDLCHSLKEPGVLDKLNAGGIANSAVIAAAAAAAAKGQPVSAASGDGTVRAAVAADDTHFDTPYERFYDKDKLWKPHDAEYDGFSYSMSINQLYGLGMHSNDFRSRPWPTGRVLNLNICKVVVLVIPVVGKTCKIINAAPNCIPTPPVCLNPAKESVTWTCWIGYALLKLVEFFCVDNYNQMLIVDRSINGMQTLATHENTKKAMDNQKIIWYKAHREYTAYSQLLQTRFTSMLQRQCKLENAVAAAQREVNYLRKLLLTPDSLKPGFGCFAQRKCAAAFNQTSCVTQCSMTSPSVTGRLSALTDERASWVQATTEH